MSVSEPGSPNRTATEPPSAGTARRTPDSYRPEIEGLRAVAVLLVAAYHIWFGRVSGGVDVFLLLTGFLITGSLVRAIDRDGRIRFAAFWSRLARRLVPAAATVLAATLAATFLLLPRSRWSDILAEVRAAALYHENWVLARAAVDYLAREGDDSPVQHFWSLSVQGQFYLLWPVLLTLAVLLASRSRRSLRGTLLAAAGAVFALSLAYSVWITAHNQAWAYFDTGARLWELALGALLALVIHRIDLLPVRLRVLMGWAGLAALVSCGLLLQVSTLFPGYVALWPTGAAVLVIAAGTTGSRFGADRLLTWAPLAALGKLSYSLYLWHWLVLVCYLHVTERTLASATGGALVLGLSLLLAWLTRRFVENGVERLLRAPERRAPAWSLGAAAGFLVPLLAASALWTGQLAQEQRIRAQEADDPGLYPGAQVISTPGLAEELAESPVLPDPADAEDDLSEHHEEGCHVNLASAELVVCDSGPADAEYTLAMVGASRTAHWYPAVEAAAEANGWRLLSFTKSGCQFSTETPYREGELFTECEKWNELAMAALEEDPPDAVFTSSTRATAQSETVHEGFVERWRQLEEMGIDVIGVRDLPRRSYMGAECVDGGSPKECTMPASFSHADRYPVEGMDLPGNVTPIDLTEHVCPGGVCDAVVGNVLVFWDHSHMTASYARTLQPVVEEALREATGW